MDNSDNKNRRLGQRFVAWLAHCLIRLGIDNPDTRHARAQGNLVSLVIGIAVAVIVGVGVAIPIVNDVLATSNITGLTKMIVGFIPVMLGVLIFVATVGPIMNRT